MTTEVRHPRVGDGVITWAETASIVVIDRGHATIERDDDVRLTVPVERLRWTDGRWVIMPESSL